MMTDRTTKHPTFGVVGLSRVTGNVRLFSSHMETNSSFIKLTVKRAEHKFHLGQTWIHGGDHLCEVYLSPAQFAQLLTDMNHNDGVPCTIRYVKGEPDPGEVPEMPSEHKHIRDDVKAGLGGLAGKLRAAKATAMDAIGERVPKAVRAACAILWQSGGYVGCADGASFYDPAARMADGRRLIGGVLVDLTPPPLDASGNPTSVDALPILVGMLARAMGHPEGQATFTLSAEAWGPCWTLLTAWFDDRERQATHMFFARPSGGGGWKMNGISAPTNVCGPIPALASIDLTGPNAHRLALVALFTARVWENV
jgi:hypothetical protein